MKENLILTEEQIKVDGYCLQEEPINAPVDVLQWLSTSNFILSLIGKSISGNTEQIDASILRTHCYDVAH